MPSHEIQTVRDLNSDAKNASSITFADIFDETSKTAGAVARETALVTTGTVVGAIQEFQKSPVETLARAGSTVAIGAGLGALVATEAPVLVAGAAVTGVALTGKWIYDTVNPFDSRNQERFNNIGGALSDVWHHGDKRTFDASVQRMRDGAGPIALDVGLMALGGFGAHTAARYTPRLSPQYNIHELAPSAVPTYLNQRSSNLFFDLNDLAFFKTRNGPIRVDKGSPDSVPARIEMLNARAGLNKQPESHRPMSLVDKAIAPQERYWAGGNSFYFKELAYKRR